MADWMHWFIIVPTVLSILGCWWLIWYAGKQGPDPDEGETTGHSWDGLTEGNTPMPRWWLTLFNLTILFGIAYLVVYPGLGRFAGTLGWTQLGQYSDEVAAVDARYQQTFAEISALPLEQLTSNAEALAAGASLFAAHCTTCHGSDGGGAVGFPNLRDAHWQWPSDLDGVVHTITHGRSGVMPPWAETLGEQGTADMVEYVRRLGGLDHWPSQAQRAEAQWPICAACHGPDGRGNPALGAPDLTDSAWLYGSSKAAIRETLVHGRSGQMPAQKTLLSEDKIRFLAVYVKSLEGRSEAR